MDLTQKEDEPRPLKHVEICWLALTIEDIERRSKRLEERNIELDNEITFTKTLIELNDAETKSKIEKLKKELASTNATLDNVKNRVTSLENDIRDTENANQQKYQELEDQFNERRKELLSELKFYEAKINYLNDFKKRQAALQEKYNSNNELLQLREENFQIAMEELETKRRGDRDNLKQDAKKDLYQLSSDFHSEVDRNVEKPAKRLLRETVVLKPFVNAVLHAIEKLQFSRDTEFERFECRRLAHSNCKLIASSFLEKRLVSYLGRIRERTQQKRKEDDAMIITGVHERLEKINYVIRLLNSDISTLQVKQFKHELKQSILEQINTQIADDYTEVIQDLYKIKYNVYNILKNVCDHKCTMDVYVEEIKALL